MVVFRRGLRQSSMKNHAVSPDADKKPLLTGRLQPAKRTHMYKMKNFTPGAKRVISCARFEDETCYMKNGRRVDAKVSIDTYLFSTHRQG
jgi:hypothetical protein